MGDLRELIQKKRERRGTSPLPPERDPSNTATGRKLKVNVPVLERILCHVNKDFQGKFERNPAVFPQQARAGENLVPGSPARISRGSLSPNKAPPASNNAPPASPWQGAAWLKPESRPADAAHELPLAPTSDEPCRASLHTVPEASPGDEPFVPPAPAPATASQQILQPPQEPLEIHREQSYQAVFERYADPGRRELTEANLVTLVKDILVEQGEAVFAASAAGVSWIAAQAKEAIEDMMGSDDLLEINKEPEGQVTFEGFWNYARSHPEIFAPLMGWRSIFQRYAIEGTKQIGIDGLELLVRDILASRGYLGDEVSADHVLTDAKNALKDMDTDRDGFVSFNEFVNFAWKRPDLLGCLMGWRRLFVHYDIDCDMLLDVEEVQMLVVDIMTIREHAVNKENVYEKALEAMKEMDLNGDGKISMDEFTSFAWRRPDLFQAIIPRE
ncbi:hypothetical protein CYMTET_37003 [Cymbomonas tetramitiformis]|uniref:EF-hand domain-containing protein n=1 Tax=Cymbomonas tetramitiformis TaxID=36881 RepID=A0AAE0CEW9_9CHLO|nr:hypothetical protein CYMTET_37003 [Cymbomonas tetramitiformis]